MVMYSWKRVPMCYLCLVFHSFHSTSSVCQPNKVTWPKKTQAADCCACNTGYCFICCSCFVSYSFLRQSRFRSHSQHVCWKTTLYWERTKNVDRDRETDRERGRERERACYLCYPKCLETFSYFMIHFPFLVLFLSRPLSLFLISLSLSLCCLSFCIIVLFHVEAIVTTTQHTQEKYSK